MHKNLFMILASVGVFAITVQTNAAPVFRPIVERANITQLATPVNNFNALLTVEFKPDRRLRSVLNIYPSSSPLTLRDDGEHGDEINEDGVYTARIRYNFTQAKASKASSTGRLIFNAARELLGMAAPAPAKALSANSTTASIDLAENSVAAIAIDIGRELVLTDPSIVEHKLRTWEPCTNEGNTRGLWTFGQQMQQLAIPAAIDAGDFTRNWLSKFELAQTVNGFVVPARTNVSDIINKWPKTSAGKLDVFRAPFRLLAIVNRVDLRENLLFGPGKGGELRFVYGAVDTDTNACGNTVNGAMQFYVIFEYKVPKNSCDDVKQWAQSWHALGQFPLGSGEYITALTALTKQVVYTNNPDQFPNGSFLAQLRTNEIDLSPVEFIKTWELREFNLASSGSGAGHLIQVTVKQTPDLNKNLTEDLVNFINENETSILQSQHEVPETYPANTPFRGGAASKSNRVWKAGPNTSVINNPEARHSFAMNTCGGCHMSESPNNQFVHIKNRPIGGAALFSDFLTGADMPVEDVVDANIPPRRFNDLLRRQQDMSDLLSTSCLSQITTNPVGQVH